MYYYALIFEYHEQIHGMGMCKYIIIIANGDIINFEITINTSSLRCALIYTLPTILLNIIPTINSTDNNTYIYHSD